MVKGSGPDPFVYDAGDDRWATSMSSVLWDIWMRQTSQRRVARRAQQPPPLPPQQQVNLLTVVQEGLPNINDYANYREPGCAVTRRAELLSEIMQTYHDANATAYTIRSSSTGSI